MDGVRMYFTILLRLSSTTQAFILTGVGVEGELGTCLEPRTLLGGIASNIIDYYPKLG